MSDDRLSADHHRLDSGESSSRREFFTEALVLGGAVAGMGPGTSVATAEPDRKGSTMNPRLFSFVGGASGEWGVISARAVVGDPLPEVARLRIVSGAVTSTLGDETWVLRGVTSNTRYSTRVEKDALVKKQAALGRADCTHAALIPIRKNAKWWDLTQDERREIFEERSQHTAIGMKYLPSIARRLHHCRDLSEAEPFDFLTLFDFTKSDVSAFDDMLGALRATEEWKFIDREVDIRLERAV
jgi:hypothetical protein